MGRNRRVHQPLVGWLLGALLAFCAFLPVASGPVASSTAAHGAATLVRSGTHHSLDAITAPQRPHVSRSTLHLSAATPIDELAAPNITSTADLSARATTARSTPLTWSAARAPP